MYARTAEFDAAVVDGHQVAVAVELLVDGQVVPADLRVLGGDVAVDSTAAIRRHCGVTLVDPDGDFTPAGSTPSTLSPYGNEVKLYRGIAGLDLIPLGVFRIAQAELNDDGTPRWSITGYDRSRTVARSRFTEPYVVVGGTNYANAIHDLIADILPGLTYRFVTTSYTAPQLVFDAEGDPWQAAMTMADSIGCEVFFDADGACVLRPVPDPTTSPLAWTYDEGDQAIILTAQRSFTDDPGYNGVIVFGETSGAAAPVRAESWDANPASRTYYLGPYGRVPRFERSALVTTPDQAQSAADGMARRLLGVTEQVKFTSVVHPAHDAGDVVAIKRAGLGLDDVFALETFTVPLDVDKPLDGTTRRRKAAA